MAGEIHTQGVGEVMRAFKKVDTDTAKELRGEIKEIAVAVQQLARAKAIGQGFAQPGTSGRGTGALVKDIKVSVRGATALVRETATRGDFSYPAVYEYGHSRWGSKPFLTPARDELAPESEKKIEHVVDSIIAANFDE